ncbi:MAG: hypothetical protein NTX53_02795 [candidate division WOR-3 bacterium]|nr:hypothetical protein [candidate division WOR-3 bacterium]
MRFTGLLFTVCCILCAPAKCQSLETTIMLPDTLGPLTGPYCLARDDNPAHPRLYVGGQSYDGGVLVAEAITCKRLARIPTGPVAALCFVPTHNKLYIAKAGCDTIAVVDCATNQIVSMVSVAGEVPALQYNSANDRMYCGGNSMFVLDCAADTVIHTIALAATFLELDSIHNRLYAGRGGPLSVIDCAVDSVIAAIPGIEAAAALCFNPTAGKVYAVSDDTLYAICTGGDSIVARLSFTGLTRVLTCDPQRNRIYCAYSARWASIDCATDAVTRTVGTEWTPRFLACNVARDRLYLFRDYVDAVIIYDATSGQLLTHVQLNGVPAGGGWSPGLNRLYCLPPLSSVLLAAIEGSADTIAGIVPLRMRVDRVLPDTVHNRLYFAYASSGSGCIGAADCSRNIVTSYTYAGESPGPMCYNPNNNRLYWGTGHDTNAAVIAYDCSSGMVVRSIAVSGTVAALHFDSGQNRLYAYSFESDTFNQQAVNIIDCDIDSVEKRVFVPEDTPRKSFMVPEDERLWYLGVTHVVAVDCRGDSIVADALDNLGSIDDACACPEDRKIFAGWSGRPLWIIDMDNPAHVETLPTVNADYVMRFCYVPNAHKVYWASRYTDPNPGKTFFRVIDSRTNVVSDSFWASRQISGMCLDHTGNYLYCTGCEDSVVFIIDTRADSVVASVRLPSLPAGPPVLNSRTDRIYAAQYRISDNIPVIRDSMLVGFEELKTTELTSSVGTTLVSRGMPLLASTPAELFSASGRRMAFLRTGTNYIGHLTAGVYFRREKSEGRTSKVIVVR